MAWLEQVLCQILQGMDSSRFCGAGSFAGTPAKEPAQANRYQA
ncbi:hypothetical protein T1E_2326 [Pseudomonas putida DOT-T1E]|uniref:Uncharacterized protein n=1 Tax=Pseudomonas putida (strain DOT-T1E) TaxID=1196325 RepID=I7C8T2_PSEPT|nr:hypothetical protein T1E_2326 [Pseudomonas putida DOT-T1E]